MVGLLTIHGQSLVTSHSVSKRSIPLTLSESYYSDRKRTAIRFVSNKACRGCQNNLEGVSIITKLKDIIKFSRHKKKKDVRCLPTFLLSPAKSLECNDFSGWFWSSVVMPEQGLSRIQVHIEESTVFSHSYTCIGQRPTVYWGSPACWSHGWLVGPES